MKIRKAIEKVLISIVSVSIALMTLMAFWLVVARYVVTSQNPHLQALLGAVPESMLHFTIYTTTITEELLRFALIWAGLLGASYVFSIREHLSFGLVNERFRARFPVAGKWLNVLLSLMVIVFSALVLVWGGMIMVGRNMAQSSPIMLLSMGYVYSILPIAGVLICVLEFFNLYDIAVKPPVVEEANDGAVKISPLD